MKKFTFFILGVFLPLLCFAQQDTIKYYTDLGLKPVEINKAKLIFKVYQDDSKAWIFAMFNDKNIIQQRETYTDSLLSIKHGVSIEYKYGKPSLKGRYNNNLKHGNFISYDTAGMTTDVSTYYLDTLKSVTSYWDNGNRKEETIYIGGKGNAEKMVYYSNSNLASKEKYINNKLVESNYLDIEGKATVKENIESPPRFPGGIEKFYAFLSRNIRYPLNAVDVQGRVYVSFIVSETGKLEDIKIDRKLNPDFDREALRVMKLSPDWLPGVLFGKKVKVLYKLPINFNVRN